MTKVLCGLCLHGEIVALYIACLCGKCTIYGDGLGRSFSRQACTLGLMLAVDDFRA